MLYKLNCSFDFKVSTNYAELDDLDYLDYLKGYKFGVVGL